VPSAEEAAAALPAGPPPDLLLVDVRLPGRSGVALVRDLAAAQRLPATIVISGEATISETVEALRLGVFDFLEKPFSRERLRTSVRNALGRAALESEVDSLRSALGDGEILGESPPIAALRERIARAAAVDATVLILGESGTGKELVAGAVHRLSERRRGPFIKVNCAAMSPTLVEDELFGHVRGAFTDARASKRGLFEEAHGGPCSSTRSATWTRGCRPGCCACSRTAGCGASATRGTSRSTCAWSRRRTRTRGALRGGRFRPDLRFRLARLVSTSCAARPGGRTSPASRPTSWRPRAPAPDAPQEPRAGRCRQARGLRVAGQRARAQARVRARGGLRRGPDRGRRSDAALGQAGPPRGGPLLDLDAASGLGLKELRNRCEREYILHVLEREGWNLSARGACPRPAAHVPSREARGTGHLAPSLTGGATRVSRSDGRAQQRTAATLSRRIRGTARMTRPRAGRRDEGGRDLRRHVQGATQPEGDGPCGKERGRAFRHPDLRQPELNEPREGRGAFRSAARRDRPDPPPSTFPSASPRPTPTRSRRSCTPYPLGAPKPPACVPRLGEQ